MSVSLFEMLENRPPWGSFEGIRCPGMTSKLLRDTRLGDEADHAELASASLTKERVDFVHATDKIRPPTSKRSLARRA